MTSKVRKHPKFNLGQLNAGKTDVCNQIFNGKTNKIFCGCWIFLPAINTTVFNFYTVPARLTNLCKAINLPGARIYKGRINGDNYYTM